jgi:hypothetical protein
MQVSGCTAHISSSSSLLQQQRSTELSRRTVRLRTGSRRRKLLQHTAGSSRRHLCIRSTGLLQQAHTAVLLVQLVWAGTVPRTAAVLLQVPTRRQVTRVQQVMLVLVLLAQGLEATELRQQGVMGRLLLLLLLHGVLLPGVMVLQQGSTVLQLELREREEATEHLLLVQGVWVGMRGHTGAVQRLVVRLELVLLLLVLVAGLRTLQRGSMGPYRRRLLLLRKGGSVSGLGFKGGWGFGL